MQRQNHISTTTVRFITVTGVLSAVASVLMMLEFPVPLIPSFVKMDFSEIPALIAAFAFGPLSGGLVCLLKNLIHLPFTHTGGVGELCNFLMGITLVIPAGWIYRVRHSRRAAAAGCILGSLCMAAASLPLNYFISYPLYAKLMPLEQIIAAYSAIAPGVTGLFQALLVFNLPFTLIKGLMDASITFFIYKPLSPLLKGRNTHR